jgi:Fe-S cluster biogenesis protein NfuA
VKLLQVFNDYRTFCGGEGAVVQMIASIVQKHGGTARLVTRTSKGLDRGLAGKVRAFACGIYNRSAQREIARTLETERPDLVHVHNLYPLLSPSVLVACRRAGRNKAKLEYGEETYYRRLISIYDRAIEIQSQGTSR